MLLAATLVVANPAHAQSDTASCATEGAVADAAEQSRDWWPTATRCWPARDTLAGSASLELVGQ